MPRTIRTKVYKFSELSEQAKQKAIDKFRDINVEFAGWHELTYDYFKEEFASLAGFEVDKIYFTGFSSQGDGAMFEGSVIDFAPFIKSINPHVRKAIESGLITLSWSVKHSGHYYHEYCSEIDFEVSDYPSKYHGNGVWSGNIYDEIQKLGAAIKEEYYAMCRKLYRLLEEEYDNLTTDESVAEAIEANEYEFTKEGNRFA